MKSHHAALLLLGFFALGTEPILANLRKKLGKMEAHDKPPARSMATFQDLCLFPPEEGDCKANIPRFFFNSTSWKCEGFIYGGCGGNDNNFKTREECLQFCSHRELLQPGDCPRRMLPGLSRPTEAYCIEDGTCPGEQKCCLMGNIRKCVLPVGVNPGFCPRRDDATVFTEPCSFDLDCALDEKCCPSEGRRRCTKALPGKDPSGEVDPKAASTPHCNLKRAIPFESIAKVRCTFNVCQGDPVPALLSQGMTLGPKGEGDTRLPVPSID
ncbi:WAP four-disulfide core domain protein 8-like [Anolis sagrei]|uniref:WAP four-disulfide core domain protein 8-like n=1 Tax=Anolis sagrei TaxID=38937 RepID=UPI003520860C